MCMHGFARIDRFAEQILDAARDTQTIGEARYYRRPRTRCCQESGGGAQRSAVSGVAQTGRRRAEVLMAPRDECK